MEGGGLRGVLQLSAGAEQGSHTHPLGRYGGLTEEDRAVDLSSQPHSRAGTT